MLKSLLETKKCFKLVAGAGNEDLEEIKKLVYVYALAGCRYFDLSVSIDSVNAARQALKLAKVDDACICVSVGIKDDPHVKKARIDWEKCVNCGACEEICPQLAIHNAKVIKEKCIGCGRCWRNCSRGAISYFSEEKDLKSVIPEIIKQKVDTIELHADGLDENEIFSKWNYLSDNYDGLLSICISRAKLSDEDYIARIKKMTENRKPYTTIIQADGFPMSGGNDTYKSTLQTVSAAELVQNANLPVYLMLSGGTNTKTAELARLCGISYNGVAVGSYARKIVKNSILAANFWNNEYTVSQAVTIAKKLVQSV